MNKVLLVAQRELLENVKTKGFWIGILVFPLMFALFIVVPTFLERAKSARQFAVIDESGWLLQEIERRVITADLTVALQVAAQHHEAATDLDDLPSVLQELAPAIARVDMVERSRVAAAVVAPSNEQGVAPSSWSPAAADILAKREALLTWWRDLEPAQAPSQISKSQYVRRDVETAGPDAQQHLNGLIGAGELFAYFVIGPDPVNGNAGFKYVSRNLTDDELRDWFSDMASEAIRTKRLAQEEIDPGVARWIQEPARFEVRKVSEAGEETEVGMRDMLRQWSPVAFVYLLWISVFSISQMLLTNTVEEKSNRTIEVLLSSVSPLQLMSGKIAGIAATGLTVVGSWILFFVAGTKIVPLFLDAPPTVDLSVLATDPVLLGSFIAYFLLGFLLYAAILVGIGSVVNTIKEAQNLTMPVTLLLFVPLLAMIPIGRDPNGLLAKVLSYVPPFTPFVMMNRAAAPPTLVEYVVTTVLLVVSIAVAMWAAAKVFRIGILLTGKPPKPSEILRWIRAPVGVVPNRD